MSEKLGGYVLGRRIAVGGMAEIWLARAPDGKSVVVKALLPQYARDPEIVHMLEHEGRLMQKLAHPSLVRVLDVSTEGDTPFLVLEHVDGVASSELIDAMRREGERASTAMALTLVLPLLEVLEHVHGARDENGRKLDVVHRDVTPHNVLITREGEVRLGDFGIARSSLRDARTRTGIIRGKIRYLAPEQVTGSAMDARTDLYGVGLILWELVAGEPYLDAASEVELLRIAESPHFRPLPADVDPRLARVLERMLARFVEERFPDAAAVRRKLSPIASELDLEEARRDWAARARAALAVQDREKERIAAPEKIGWEAPRYAIVAVVAAALAIGGYALFASIERSRPPVRTIPRAPHTAPRAPVERTVPPPAIVEPPPMEPPRAPPSRTTKRIVRPPEEPPRRVPDVSGDLSALMGSLRQRGIRESDLSPAHTARLRAIRAALARGEHDSAERELRALSPELAAIVIDETFVRRKLDRIDARIRAMHARGVDTSRVERLSALALEDLLEGRPEATNRRLNQISIELDASSRQ